MPHIELGASLGFPGADAIDELDLPEGWGEMDQAERDQFLNDVLNDHVADHLNSWARVVD